MVQKLELIREEKLYRLLPGKKKSDRLEASGVEAVDQAPRAGILDWCVADIGDLNGAKMQLTQDRSTDGN